MASILQSFRRLGSRLLFLHHPDLKKPFLLSLLISFILSLGVLVLFFSMQPQVPLFYSLAQPEDFLADKIWLVLFPAFSIFMTVVHFFVIRFLDHHERIVPILFAWATVVVQVIFAIAFIRIIFIIM